MSIQPYYQDEAVQIFHADCREVLPFLPNTDLLLTDPPYGVGFSYESYVDDEANFDEVVMPVLSALVAASDAAVCMSMRQMRKLPEFRWVACWHKPGSTRRSSVGGWSIWEPVFLYGGGWKIPNDAVTLPDCVNHSRGNTHPCPKPEALFRWLLSHHRGVTVLDPFMGSGTTLVAAKRLGRKAIGIERERKYCDLAVERLRQGALGLEVA